MGRLIWILMAMMLVLSTASCAKDEKPDNNGAFKLGGGKQVISDPAPAEVVDDTTGIGDTSGIIDIEVVPSTDEGGTVADATMLPPTTPTPTPTPATAPPDTAPSIEGQPVQQARPGEHTLRLDFNGDCWVEVTGATGDPFKGSMKDGDSKTFGAQKYFLITLGATKTAIVYFDGKLLYGGDKPSAPKMYFALPDEASVHLKKPTGKPEGTQAATQPIAQPAPPSTPAPSTGGMHTLRIDALDECWVEVRSGGEKVYIGLMQKGDSKTLDQKAGFEITLGKPEVAAVYMDGREMFGPNAGYAKTFSINLPGSYVPSEQPVVTDEPTGLSGQILIEVEPQPQPGPAAPAPVTEPDEPPSASYRGWIETGMWSLAMKDYYAAIENFERAYEIEPNYSEVNRLLGRAYRGAGDAGKAIDYLNTALKLNPGDSDALLEMGYAYEDTGEIAKAIEYYEKYLEIKDDAEITEHVDDLRGRTSF
jgi:cytoskeletal protein RodZ